MYSVTRKMQKTPEGGISVTVLTVHGRFTNLNVEAAAVQQTPSPSFLPFCADTDTFHTLILFTILFNLIQSHPISS